METREQNVDQKMKELGSLDERIAMMLRQRFALAEEISREKIAAGDKVFDRSAEAEQITHLSSEGYGEFEQAALKELFTQIQSIGRKKQYQLLREYGAAGRLPFIMVDDIDKKDVRVVFQGVEGAYSHAAMCTYFGNDVQSFHVDSFADAMEAIADGEADYAVLPIENSEAGIVGDSYDLLNNYENYIVAEQNIHIDHVLMGVPGTGLNEIETVFSHPQALAQCKAYLDEHRSWEQVRYANTAMAARKVAEEGIRTHAAIGSRFAAERFGLEVLAENICYNDANTTRFIIVTNQRVFRKDADKVSISFELPNTSGALYHILAHFIYNNVNMYRIESRPIPGRNWQYRFFIDFDGNLNESRVKNTIRGIRSEAIGMQILGNY